MKSVRGALVKEEGHATQVIQLKVYRPARPVISASVNEKFYHNVKKDWDPSKGLFRAQSKHEVETMLSVVITYIK